MEKISNVLLEQKKLLAKKDSFSFSEHKTKMQIKTAFEHLVWIGYFMILQSFTFTEWTCYWSWHPGVLLILSVLFFFWKSTFTFPKSDSVFIENWRSEGFQNWILEGKNNI